MRNCCASVYYHAVSSHDIRLLVQTPAGVEARAVAAPQVYLPNGPQQAAAPVPAPIVANSDGQEP